MLVFVQSYDFFLIKIKNINVCNLNNKMSLTERPNLLVVASHVT